MNRDVIITCAVTGSGDTAAKHPELPITPSQIAQSALAAAEAGAAVVHIHVRQPETGAPSRDPGLYAQVVDEIRAADTDVVLNLTAGMGGDLTVGPEDAPDRFVAAETDLAPAAERLIHVRELEPEICTLDCGTMNFGDDSYVMTNTPRMLRAMARMIGEIGVQPEVEVFDFGHLWLANQLHAEGLIAGPPLYQLCLGIPYGAPADSRTMATMAGQLPADANWSGFGIGRDQMPMVAQAMLLGGNVRVGLEDNLYLDRGVFASNAQLVARARTIIEALGGRVASPADARRRWGLTKRR